MIFFISSIDINAETALLYNLIEKLNVHRERKDPYKYKSSFFLYIVKMSVKLSVSKKLFWPFFSMSEEVRMIKYIIVHFSNC